MNGESMLTEYKGDGESVFVPDIRIRKDKPEHNYSRARGTVTLCVFDLDDRCIGWMDPRDIGYPDANAAHAGRYKVKRCS